VTVAPARNTQDTTRATLLIVLSACCFGSVSPLTVLALRGGAELPSVQVWRYATSAFVLISFAALRATPTPTPTPTTVNGSRRWYHPTTLLIAGGGQTLVVSLALMALQWIPAATEAFLFYTFPAWVAVMTAMRGVERLDRTRVGALTLALCGIAIMVGAPSAGSLHPIGVSLALTAALVYAIYIPILGGLQRTLTGLDVSRAISVGGTIVFGIWALATGSLTAHFTPMTYVLSVLQGLLSAVGFLAFLRGLSHLGAVRTAITSTVEPFWTSMLGVVLLGQPVGGGTLLGGAAIMVAVLLLQRPVVSSTPLHSSSSSTDSHTGRPHP